jgi:hypothetical protein
MKFIINVEVLISLSLFFFTFSFFLLFFIHSQSSQVILMRENKLLLKSLSISQILLYLNHSYSISTLNYTILNETKVNNFFNFCSNNKEKIKNDFGVRDFNIILNCSNNPLFVCSSKNIAPKVRRLCILNNKICYLEIGIE